MNETHFCRELTRASGEPIGGSAPFADQFIFITWPKKFWNREALESGGGFPQGLKAWSKSNSSPGNKITIRLLSKPGLETTSVSLFLYPQAKMISGLNPEQVPEVLERWLDSPENPGLGWETLETEQLFVCTHGKHDLCCAKFGQTVYQRLREEASDRKLELDVWEASHLGGHRFAANLMRFPGGHSHGHLQEDMVPAFLDDWEAGKIHASTYRGCSYLEGKEQIVSAQLLQYCSDSGWDVEMDFEKIEEGTESEFHCEVSLQPRRSESNGDSERMMPRQLRACFKAKEFQSPGACDALDEIKKRNSWVLHQVQTLE